MQIAHSWFLPLTELEPNSHYRAYQLLIHEYKYAAQPVGLCKLTS